MKYKFILLFVLSVLFVSCSSDESKDNENSIIGIWEAFELKINNDTASDDEKMARDLLNFLSAKQCYVLSFNFKQDMNVVIENSINYLEVNINAGGTGIDVPCPTQKDIETQVYAYVGGKLSYVDDNGQDIFIDVTIAGDLMTVDASDLDIPNLDASGQLIFKRK